jgi:hypothetical protein
MPHPLRSPSVASFQSLFRSSSSASNLKKNANVDSHGLVSILPLASGSIQHLHMIPAIPVTLQPDNSVIEWISRIQETRPEVLIATSPKYFTVNEVVLKDIEPGSIRLNSSASASLVFLRILNTKIYGWNEKSTYHMSVRILSNENSSSAITSTSCNSSSKTGDLIDNFLM